MNRSASVLIFTALLVSMVSLAYGLNYAYFSEQERTRFNDWVKFMNGDTICGPVRSDDQIAIMQGPRFCDFVISSAPDFWRGVAYNPEFDYRPVTNAPELFLPARVQWIRDGAAASGYFYNTGDTVQTWALLSDHAIRFWTAHLGQPIDSNIYVDWPLPDSVVVFVNGPLDISGVVHSILIIGAAGRVGIPDNILYASSRESDGQIVAGHPEKFALISESEIKIRNTVANGRENSSGHGLPVTDPATSSIFLNGIFVALDRSILFDQQNDPDSGYVCQCQPDDRGYLKLWGSTIMKQKNYYHRSTRSSTGYQRQILYDNDLKFWNLSIFDARENQVTPASINFGEVAVGQTARDTVRVANDYVPIRLDSMRVSTPFAAVSTTDTLWSKAIPVTFAPAQPGIYLDTLRFYNGYYHQWYAVPVRGTCGMAGVDGSSILHPSSFILSASPNPFNPLTSIHFEIARAGQVTLRVYNLVGREVETLKNERLEAGAYKVVWDASGKPSGIYFARLECADGVRVEKLLLTK